MWSSSLFRWFLGLGMMHCLVVSYVSPTITKAVGQNLSVSAIAGLGLAGSVLSLLQAPVAKWVPPRVILYAGSFLGIPTALLIFSGCGAAALFAVVAVRVAWILGIVIGHNWQALAWEALATEEAPLSQMQATAGSVCSGAGLVGVGLAFLYPPSLEVAVVLAGLMEAVDVPLSIVTARKVLARL